MTTSVNNKLMVFVDFNEDTKRVMQLANDVELMSMNALLANKNSSAESGFSAVADQLRDFSLEVIERAKTLTAEFSNIILYLASERNLIRRDGILNNTKLASPVARKAIDKASADVKVRLREAGSKFEATMNRAAWLIEYIDRQCLIGGGLSRVGKIEATYGGSLEPMLFQIAKDVGLIILQIFNITSELKDKVKVYLT